MIFLISTRKRLNKEKHNSLKNADVKVQMENDSMKFKMDLIENVWGRMLDMGEYCWREYLPWINVQSRYKHPVMDSACHGSGGSPAYWLQKLFS